MTTGNQTVKSITSPKSARIRHHPTHTHAITSMHVGLSACLTCGAGLESQQEEDSVQSDAPKLQIQKLLCVSDVSTVEANRISSKEAYDRYIKNAWPNGSTGIKTTNCFGQVWTMVPFTLPPLPRFKISPRAESESAETCYYAEKLC